MKLKVEFSQIVRRKMKTLRETLSDRFGADTANKALRSIMQAAKGLSEYPEKENLLPVCLMLILISEFCMLNTTTCFTMLRIKRLL